MALVKSQGKNAPSIPLKNTYIYSIYKLLCPDTGNPYLLGSDAKLYGTKARMIQRNTWSPSS